MKITNRGTPYFVPTFVLALLLIAPPLSAADGPSRSGLLATRPPTAVLGPALEEAPGALASIAAHNLSGTPPLRDGLVRDLDEPARVRLTAADLSRPTPFESGGGLVTRAAGPAGEDLVWTGDVRVARAHTLRLHVAAPELPAGTRAWILGAGGEAVEVPLDAAARTGGTWTGIVAGDRAWLEVRIPAAALRAGDAVFTLDRVVEGVRLDRRGRPLFGAESAPKAHCFVEMTCAQEDFPKETAHYRLAVALYSFVDGGFQATCTGALVADTDTGSRRPLFLTARHCVGSDAVAATVSARFRYWNQGCGGPAAAGQQVFGASLLASGTASDFALLELRRVPSGTGFLEWDERPGAATPGNLLTLISHPFGRPQVFSRHQVVTQGNCSGPGFFSTATVFGGSGPGASGAPVVNRQGRVVGQLRGGCGPSPGDGCRADTFVTFGRLSTSFPAISSILDPEPEDEPEPEPDDGFLRSSEVPGFKFQVEIGPEGSSIPGAAEAECLPETLCVSGALPGRSELFLRVVGPRPNGKLWPLLVKLTTSRVEVTVIQEATGDERHYVLPGATPGSDSLPGLFDRDGFTP